MFSVFQGGFFFFFLRLQTLLIDEASLASLYAKHLRIAREHYKSEITLFLIPASSLRIDLMIEGGHVRLENLIFKTSDKTPNQYIISK